MDLEYEVDSVVVVLTVALVVIDGVGVGVGTRDPVAVTEGVKWDAVPVKEVVADWEYVADTVVEELRLGVSDTLAVADEVRVAL